MFKRTFTQYAFASTAVYPPQPPKNYIQNVRISASEIYIYIVDGEIFYFMTYIIWWKCISEIAIVLLLCFLRIYYFVLLYVGQNTNFGLHVVVVVLRCSHVVIAFAETSERLYSWNKIEIYYNSVLCSRHAEKMLRQRRSLPLKAFYE